MRNGTKNRFVPNLKPLTYDFLKDSTLRIYKQLIASAQKEAAKKKPQDLSTEEA